MIRATKASSDSRKYRGTIHSESGSPIQNKINHSNPKTQEAIKLDKMESVVMKYDLHRIVYLEELENGDILTHEEQTTSPTS